MNAANSNATEIVNPTNKRSIGAKYLSTKDLGDTELVKLIRNECKAALPKGFKVSVRKEIATWSLAVNIQITGVPAGFVVRHESGRGYSPDAERIVDKLEAIAEAFNYNNSDSQVDYFDVRFYLHVGFNVKAVA